MEACIIQTDDFVNGMSLHLERGDLEMLYFTYGDKIPTTDIIMLAMGFLVRSELDI